MKPFSERREIILALQRFRPGMEDREKEPPVGVLLFAFLVLIGSVATAGGFIVSLWMLTNG